MELHSGVAGRCGNTAVVLLVTGHHDVALHPPFSAPAAEEEKGRSTQAIEARWRQDATKVQMWFDGELKEFDESLMEVWWRNDRSLMKV